MKPLKALILITKANWGGAQRYVFDLATRLPKDRFAVKVMAGSEGPLTKKLWDAGIHATGDLKVGRDLNLWQDFKAFIGLVFLLRKDRPDILHVNSSKIGGIGALAGRLAGVKRIVFTAHGWAFNEDRPIASRLVIRSLYWVTMALSHETIAVSEAARQQVRGWPMIQDKIAVIHNGVSKEAGFSRANARLELTRAKPELKRAIEGASESGLILIGSIAELHPIKGYDHAIKAAADRIKAFNLHKKIVYAIIGEGEDRPRLEALIEELGMQEHILLLGHVDNAAQYANAFDIFLLASLSEGLGYAILEAGAAAVPVVATNVGGIPEIIDDMRSGILVQPKNPRELAHAISFMIEHPEERRKLGSALKERVAKDFSLEKMIDETGRVYLGL